MNEEDLSKLLYLLGKVDDAAEDLSCNDCGYYPEPIKNFQNAIENMEAEIKKVSKKDSSIIEDVELEESFAEYHGLDYYSGREFWK